MSTTTITPEVLAASQSNHFVALLKSYWLKTKAAAAPLFSTVRGYLSAALSWVPNPLTALVAPVALTTRWGYRMLGKGAGFVTGLAGRTIGGVAKFAHHSIDWVGERITDLIGVFSETAAKKVTSVLCDFSDMRLSAGMFVGAVVRSTASDLSAAFNSKVTRGSVAITSAAVAGTIVLNAVAPSTFLTMIAGLPVASAASISAIALGGWAALAPIAGIGAGAMLYSLIAPLFRRTKAIEVVEVKAPAMAMKSAPVEEPVVLEGTVVSTVDEAAQVLADEAKASESAWKGDINKPSPTKHGKRNK